MITLHLEVIVISDQSITMTDLGIVQDRTATYKIVFQDWFNIQVYIPEPPAPEAVDQRAKIDAKVREYAAAVLPKLWLQH